MGSGGEKTRKAKRKKAIPTIIVSVLVVIAVGLGIGWLSASSEASSLGNEMVDLQEDFGELQENYNNLDSNYRSLEENYTELEENLKPSFPSGTTDDQLFAWVMLRLEMLTSYLTNHNEYVENEDTWNKIQCQYYREKIIELSKDLENIKTSATSVYLSGIEKLEEAIDWDIKQIDNDMLYLETWSTIYHNLALECSRNADAAANEATKLLWGWGV